MMRAWDDWRMPRPLARVLWTLAEWMRAAVPHIDRCRYCGRSGASRRGCDGV